MKKGERWRKSKENGEKNLKIRILTYIELRKGKS
jgi:hypothetical protein